jgi:hypothetical protein
MKPPSDFERALYLWGDLSHVAGSQFYYVTRALKAAGRYCDAIAPLKLFVSFDPAERKTTLVDREIAELTRLGACDEDAAPGRQVVKLKRHAGVLLIDAEINGVAGRFILDTGASAVHLTRKFALKVASGKPPSRLRSQIFRFAVAGDLEDAARARHKRHLAQILRRRSTAAPAPSTRRATASCTGCSR